MVSCLGINDTEEAYDSRLTTLRESGDSFLLWDTKTTSFNIQGTPTELDIFIAGSKDRRFGTPVYASAGGVTRLCCFWLRLAGAEGSAVQGAG